MRLIGIVLVVLGALALAYQGFSWVTRERVAGDGVREETHTVWVPPVVGGITVVSGLLLLAVDGRRGDNGDNGNTQGQRI
jgi:hypothetical protein